MGSWSGRRVLVGAVLAGAAVLIGGAIWLRYDAYRLDRADIELTQLCRAYAHYLRDHEGRFPEAFSDLASGPYLIQQVSTQGRTCTGPPARAGEFLPVYEGYVIGDIERFEFLYHASVDELEVREDGVYRGSSTEPLVLVRPSRSALLDRSRQYTRRVVERFRELAGQPAP